MSKLTALAGVSLLLMIGCERKKPETQGAPAGSPAPAAGASAAAATPGVTATEIKIGQSTAYSGPASSYGVIGKAETAYFKMINDKGGINGRKLNLISLDDGYSPPKAVENVRKLVEGEGVAFIFNNLGTAPNAAVQKYLNDKKIPQLFVATGADRWADPKNFPWTIGFQPSYRGEARTIAGYLLKEKPAAKLCVLFQNDDFGKDYLIGLKEGLGDQYDKIVIKTQSYEVSDPTVDSPLVTLQAAGCDTLLTAATPKFGAQTIRKIYDLGWKPLHIISSVSVSRVSVLRPAGLEKCKGLVTVGYIKDITDPSLANDPGLKEFREFAQQYLTGFDLEDANLVYAFAVSKTLVQVLTQAGNDLSRENIMKQATSLQHLQLGVTGNGVEVNTAADDFRPISQGQLARFTGDHFEPFGDVVNMN